MIELPGFASWTVVALGVGVLGMDLFSDSTDPSEGDEIEGADADGDASDVEGAADDGSAASEGAKPAESLDDADGDDEASLDDDGGVAADEDVDSIGVDRDGSSETESSSGGLLSKLDPRNWFGDDEPTVELHELMDDEMTRSARDGSEAFDRIEEMQVDAVAPAAVEWDTRTARVGESWTATMYIADWPDYPQDGFLSELFMLSDVQFDLTVHLRPKDQEFARQQLRETADDLQVDADFESSVRGNYLQERANEAASTYKAVEDGTQVFDQAMFVTVRADDEDALEDAQRKIRSTLRDDPANLTPKSAICKQDDALQSTAPVGRNEFGRETIALGGAVGALLASPNKATILEAGGVEFGKHKGNDSPVVVDPFERDNGYSMFTVGDVGSGKSFGAKQNFVRTIEQERDRIGVILEPLGNWSGVAEALGAQRITVGGTLGLNPLEIKPTPDHVAESMASDASPFKEKKDDAMSFLTNYFALRDVDLGDRRTTLELALHQAYERKGITDDPETHSRESPTIRTVMDVLEEMVDDPESYVVRTVEEADKLAEDGAWLIDQLRPFEADGRYSNLGKPTEFDMRDEKVFYLDLSQQEGSVGGATSLLMQLLISLVYERAKETSKEVVLAIDEARYIMQDAANLEYLETVFRHHRHHDLSIRLITQTIDEFLETSESEAIMDQIAIKQFHRLDGMDESIAEEFGLNTAQKRFVQNAVPGSEETGFSDALLGVDGEWRGIEVHAMPKEQRVIDFEPRESSRADLPGAGRDEDERLADEFEERLQERRVDHGEGSSFEWGEE